MAFQVDMNALADLAEKISVPRGNILNAGLPVFGWCSESFVYGLFCSYELLLGMWPHGSYGYRRIREHACA